MPVQKFKSFQEAEEALWVMKPDEDYYKKVANHWEFVKKFRPAEIPKGVFKFKSIKKANKHRDQIDLDIAKKIYKERFETKN